MAGDRSEISNRSLIKSYIKITLIQLFEKEIKMKTAQSQASKPLFKKLSALHATLPDEEVPEKLF
jgi:hypothetical protein